MALPLDFNQRNGHTATSTHRSLSHLLIKFVAEFSMLFIFFSESIFSGMGEIEVTAVTSDCNLKTASSSSPHGRIRFREVNLHITFVIKFALWLSDFAIGEERSF